MQRMADSALDGAIGRDERLAEHLAAEHLRAADVAALAAEQVDLERLQLEHRKHVGQPLVHARLAPDRANRRGPLHETPSRFCMTGLVVVYCRNCFFSGYSQPCTPNAASAASWNPDRISFFLPG